MIEAQRHRLDSGATVIAVRRPHLHTVAMGAFVGVGTRHEDREEQGLAHFLEHLLFRGSERWSDSIELSRQVDRLGGYVDAWVHQELTAYLIDVHRDHWVEGLRLLGDVFLEPTFTERQVEIEKSILLEEMGQYTDSRGDNVNLFDLVYHLMWGDGVVQADFANLRRNLDRFGRDDVVRFHRRHYTAGNTVLVVAGDFDVKAAIAQATALLAAVPPGGPSVFQPAPTAPERAACVFRYYESTQMEAALALRAYSYHHPDYPAARVLAEVLGGGTASRLFATVREERGLVYDIRSELAPFHDVGAITISTTCGEQNLEPTLSGVLEVLETLATDGITDEELDRAQRLIRLGGDYLLDHPMDLVDWYGRFELLDRPPALRDPREEATRFADISMVDLKRVVAEVLRPQNRYLAVTGPVRPRQKRHLEKLFRERTAQPGPAAGSPGLIR